MSFVHQSFLRDALAEVSHFRSELYACMTAPGDALFESCDALLCTDGPVRTLIDLALAPEHRRGHGAQSFLHRFDVEHTFRLFNQTLGWTEPRLRSSEAADRWTWLVIAAYAQLRLTRPLATDLRRPWEKPAAPNKLTPARVRGGFRNLHAKTASPAGAPKPSRPGPGRPLDSKNRRPATRQ